MSRSVVLVIAVLALTAAFVTGGCLGRPSGSIETNVTIRSFGSHAAPKPAAQPEARKCPVWPETPGLQ